MQSDSGLLGWLKVPSIYNIFSATVGGNVLRRSLIQNHVRAKLGDKVIDIGCGTAEVLRYLPDVDYIGIDINQNYIAFARRTYGNRGTFLVGDTQSFRGEPREIFWLEANVGRVCGKLKYLIAQSWTKAAPGTYPIVALEASFACEAPFHFSLRRKASLLAFKNDSHVRDSQWVRVHPCI